MGTASRIDKLQYFDWTQGVEVRLYQRGFVKEYHFMVLLENLPHNNVSPHNFVVEVDSEMVEETFLEGYRLVMIGVT